MWLRRWTRSAGCWGVESFAASPAGYRKLYGWLNSFGPLARVGVEGTGAYGAGLARHLHGRGGDGDRG